MRSLQPHLIISSLIGEGTGNEAGEETMEAEERDASVDSTYANPDELTGLALQAWMTDAFCKGGNREMRIHAVTIFHHLARHKVLPLLLLHVSCWVIGEFGGDVPYESEYPSFKEFAEEKRA